MVGVCAPETPQNDKPHMASKALAAKNSMGTIRAGSRLMVLQSLIWSTPRPDAAIRMPPTSDTSEISSSDMNERDTRAMP